MDHNEIYSLNGSVSGFRNLVRLDVSYNRLTKILPDDLIGLDRLNMLDISHNHLLTLEETSKVILDEIPDQTLFNLCICFRHSYRHCKNYQHHTTILRFWLKIFMDYRYFVGPIYPIIILLLSEGIQLARRIVG